MIEPIGKGGCATVYRGAFHSDKAAFKFIPVDNFSDYEYKVTSVGLHEYYQQEKISEITKLKKFECGPIGRNSTIILGVCEGGRDICTEVDLRR